MNQSKINNSIQQPCPYCADMISAFPESNFCSHYYKDSEQFESNAFYFSGLNVSSRPHKSRLSIRTILAGYQSYSVDGNKYELFPDNFILVNKGQQFENKMFPNARVEGLIISFSTKFINDYVRVKEQTHEHLLYKYKTQKEIILNLTEHTFTKSPQLNNLFIQLSEDIKIGTRDKLYYLELFTEILDEIAFIQENIDHKIDTIQSQKASTKTDLYNRLTKTKDYIDINLAENLSLEKLARVAYMSPFHFLRSYTQLYRITPHQYVRTQRLKKAEYLLKNLKEPIEDIMAYTGFENKRTFQRAFAQMYGITPLNYQKKYCS